MQFAPTFLQGVTSFNSRQFYAAHEFWEELWLSSQTELKPYLQGLIQLAAAYHHVQRGTISGAVRLFDAALAKLEAFPPVHLGVDRTAAVAAARRDRERLARGDAAGDSPTLELVSEVPPLASW